MFPGSAGGIDVSGKEQRARGIGPRARFFLPRGLLLSLLWAVLLSGCQRGTADHAPVPPRSGNHPPVIRAASVLPNPLVLNGPISVTIEAQDLDRNPLSFRYQWMLDGQPIPSEQGEELRPELLKRGNLIAVTIWPYDGTVEGDPYTTVAAAVQNSPPIVSHISIEPAQVTPGMQVRVQADIQDADRDPVKTTYRWWKNETLAHEGEDAEFDTAGFDRGDRLSVEVIVSDGVTAGRPVRSAALTVGNSPPRIASRPATMLHDGQFSYQVEAVDAESDAMTFSLESAPTGMTIDQQKGLVTWRVTPGQTGAHKVRILVTDSQGAASFQEFHIEVAPGVSAG